MKKSLIAGVGAALAAAALVVTASPASAAPWPNNGYFDIPGTMAGGATWHVEEYGISSAGDTADSIGTWLYYPLENYAGDYFYCGTTDGSDATVTNETNGDVTVDCQPVADTFATGLTGTLHIRLYAEDSNGYMARVWGELTNTTNSTIDLSGDPLAVYYYYNYNAWDNGDPWMTNAGGGDDGLDGSVWGAGGDIEDNQIATSAVWGDVSQACRIKTTSYGMFYPADSNVIPAGATVNLVSFINMIFPATNDAAGTTAAYEKALAHAQGELAQGLTGRLAAGLPADFVATGWEQNDACVPQLPNTGVDTASAASFTAGAIAVGMLGLGFVVIARRRARA